MVDEENAKFAFTALGHNTSLFGLLAACVELRGRDMVNHSVLVSLPHFALVTSSPICVRDYTNSNPMLWTFCQHSNPHVVSGEADLNTRALPLV